MKKIIGILGVVLVMCITIISTAVCAKSTTTSKAEAEVVTYVYVDIKGEVENPGVYRVSDKCRVFQVLEIAGGLKSTSDTSSINLAAKINDEQMIIVPSIYGSSTLTPFTLVNINTATASELDSLPGVGYTVATNIINYRQTNGSFRTKEEIKQVNGIGDAIYEQIKDLITI